MQRRLHIVVTCTKQKGVPVPPRMCLGSINSGDLKKRFSEWCKRLDTDAETHLVADLYSGDHWVNARQLPEIASVANVDASLWVISTGLGLVNNREKVPAYSATFSTRHCDAVSRETSDFAIWWDMLCARRRQSGSAPASLQELIAAEPCASFLVVVSEAYLTAVRTDLELAAGKLGVGGELLVISAGTARSGLLAKFLLPADARFQKRLGGIRRSLNIRLAKQLLQECPDGRWRQGGVIERFGERLTRLPPLETPTRTSSSDVDIGRFILGGLRANPPRSKTVLLRDFRASGRACEQTRFGQIFRQTLEIERAS